MISCKQANEMDLVNYLEKLGYHPTRISRNDYWYLSPLRDEKTASFKVNRKLNLWFDHGNGKGGTLVDFGTSLFNCSVKEFLKKLGEEHLEFSFHQPLAGEKKKKVEEDSKIKILQVADIRSLHLIQYLKKRSIHPELAEKFCREIFLNYTGKNTMLSGFKTTAVVGN
jgi:DNA primase